jgi:hypothetical protein
MIRYNPFPYPHSTPSSHAARCAMERSLSAPGYLDHREHERMYPGYDAKRAKPIGPMYVPVYEPGVEYQAQLGALHNSSAGVLMFPDLIRSP